VLALALALALEPSEPIVEPIAFRHVDPDRGARAEVAPTLGDKLFTIGSQNAAQWAPELGLRGTFGSARWSGLVSGAVSPLIPVRRSIAAAQGGAALELVLAARVMPVQRRLVRFGGWVGLALDGISARVELEPADGGAQGRKWAGHVGPELGLELAFPLVFPRADRRWSLDLFLAHGIRFSFPTRTILRIEDSAGTIRTEHLARELGVVGPFSGASLGGRIGVAVAFDLADRIPGRGQGPETHRSQTTAR
jgi:hypothetical protein